ncbi:MAG: LemA family protein [Dinghuibacter sp.]|nr:LemA family protein [Dinghuibacter sp.]
MQTTYILAGSGLLVVIIIFWLIKVYNELVKGRITVQEGFSGVGTCLQQRNDLIPNLVETVKGYAGHENKTLVEVIKWRNQSAAATTPEEQNAASAELNKALINVLSLAESYPELKASANFQALQAELSAIEDKISHARRYYNGTVREYNQDIAVFPKNIVGGMFGFKPAVFFAEDAAAHTAPAVNFS